MTATATTERLNPEQLAACTTLTGQLLVLAGPGTGKTRVITHRYRNLLDRPGTGTDNVVVLTFTEKAAREMEDRISTLCETGFAELRVSTFHAFALRFLQENGAGLPIPFPFRLAGDVDRYLTMCEVLERLRPAELYHLPRPRDVVPDLVKLLERAKQEMAGPDEYLAAARELAAGHHLGAEAQGQIAEVYAAHQAAMTERGLLDFDDTIYWTVRLLESDPAVLARSRERFTQVMVDEFQDTNFAQLRLVELLAGPEGNICVVGDDDQSIYKFRGASVANLRRFRRVYPGTAIVRLERNYRSTAEVLEPAHRLIAHNPERVGKRIVSERQGPAARLYQAPDRDHEVAWVTERVVELMEGPAGERTGPAGEPAGAERVAAGEIAILVRTNAQLRPMMRALQRAGIPYQLSGGRGFLDQPEIKDLRAFLQLAVDPTLVADAIPERDAARRAQATCRVLAMPGVGLPAEVIGRLAAVAARDGVGIEAALAGLARRDPDGAGAGLAEHAAALARLGEVLAEVRAVSYRERADEVVMKLLELTRYVHLLDYPSEIQKRQAGANVDRFMELAQAFCEGDRAGEASTLAHFMRHLDGVEESGAQQAIAQIETAGEAVNLMTVHQAKGLEFDAVICPGLVEDRFPLRQLPDRLTLAGQLIQEEAPSRDQHVAEERRLAYVALTRARRHALFSAAARYEGGKRWKPSRFLVELGLLPGPDGSVAHPPRPEPAPAVAPEPAPAAAQAALPISHPEVPELAVSYSQLEAYRRCPRAYQYANVYHLPARPSAELEFGKVAHAALARILGDSRRATLAGEAAGAQAPLAECLAVFDSAFDAVRFPDPVNADLWRERGRDFVRALHARGRLSGRDLHLDPEQPFTLRLSGFRVNGRIDRIDRRRDGYRLLDYKTGEPRPEWELERDLQLGLYAIAADRVLGLGPVELAICNLDGTEVPVLKTSSQLDADREVAEVAAAGIMAGEFSPRPEPWKCRHCDFRMVCDAAL
ncbi:MAG TPA: ATP-dependent DNA helicase [Candidatus Dormibacteraeota bacterium]|nr:ATP-dependent DNA helicase [Candidatus Dormibacteraeota bacterium]